mgnify:FL=1|jgi:hypothetical protein
MENNKIVNAETKDARLVFNCGVCRALLKVGATIIDVKPDRTNAETGKERSVFVFKNDEVFQREFARINKEIAEAKTAKEKEAQ